MLIYITLALNSFKTTTKKKNCTKTTHSTQGIHAVVLQGYFQGRWKICNLATSPAASVLVLVEMKRTLQEVKQPLPSPPPSSAPPQLELDPRSKQYNIL